MDFLINEQLNTDLVKQQQLIYSNQTQLLQIAKENPEELIGSLVDIKLHTPPDSLPCSPDSSNLNQPFYNNLNNHLIENKNKEEDNQLNNMLTTHHQTIISKLDATTPSTPPRTPSDDSPITSSNFGNAISTSAEVLGQSQQLLDSKHFPFNVLNNPHSYVEQQTSVADAFASNLFRTNGQVNGSQPHDQLYNMLGGAGGGKTLNNEQHHQILNDNHWLNSNQSQNFLQQQMAVAAVHPLTAHHTLNNSLNVELINHGLNTSNNSNLNCTSGSEAEETQAVSSSSVSPNLQQQHQQQSALNQHNQTGNNNQIITNQSLNGLTFTNQITNSLTEHHLNYYQSTSLHHTTDNNFILPRSTAILPMHNGQNGNLNVSSPHHHHNIANQLVHNQQNQLVNHQTPINQLSNRLPINNSNSDTFNQFIQQQHPNHQLNHQSLHLANLPNHHGLFHHHNANLNSPITHSNTRCSTRFNQNSTSVTNQRNNLLNNQHEQNLNLNSMQYETNSNSSSNTLCTTTSSTIGHNLTSSSTDQPSDAKVQIDDNSLIELSVRDLNKRLHGKPKELVQKLKQKRRTLKNRGYAQNCRTKRLHIKNEMEEELKSTKQQVKIMQKELAHLRSHCENCPIYNQQQSNSIQFNHLSLQGQFQRNLEEHQTNQLHLSQSTHHHNDLNGQSNTTQ